MVIKLSSSLVTLLIFCSMAIAIHTLSSPVRAQGAPSIEATIDITPELRSRAGPDQVVFVFAKAVQGPRAPLAVVKLKVKELPATVL
ncbi:MAG: hypothetical protein GY721_02345, partial [Deltaproteobacteria bacterium]|nr:hypothetical protein [Deltaproteobacteria bacterium]